MDAKIFRVNYKSDFILTLESDAGWMTPFCIKFWTGAPSQAYYVGWDGTTYNHCAYDPSDPTKLQVQFDDHHLPIGDLKFQVAYHFTVADFPNDTEDEVINPANITTEIDGETYKVMLDFTGETAPEIQFSLPAYANEAQRIANEQQRIANEQTRISQEQSRVQAEQQRVQQENARVVEFGNIQNQANDDHLRANEDHSVAVDDHRQAVSDHGIAVDDHTQAGNDHTRAESDHSVAVDDHTQAGNDHTRAESDHSVAVDDHTQAGNDHTRAESDHSTAASDHTQAGNDHTRAESDHTRAESDHAAVEVFVDSLGVFDLSKHNAVNGVLATYADLSAALTALNALESKYKYGGMSFKFVQSSDNKYVQWRLTTSTWSADPNDWVAENEDFRNEVMQEVNEAIEANTPIVVEGNVNNVPDEEDLTSVNQDGTDVLKFKDKAYIPLTYSGMGRVYLRKNMVNGVNTLTQDMFYKGEVDSRVPNTNTIFVIQYDYVIDSANDNTITIPADCVLDFQGGSLSNGTITGQNTGIDAGLVKIFNTDVTLAGSWNIQEVYPEWFSAVGDGVIDDSAILSKTIAFALQHKVTVKLTQTYLIEHSIILNNYIAANSNKRPLLNIDGTNSGCIIIACDYVFDATISKRGGYTSITGVTFKRKDDTYSPFVISDKFYVMTFNRCTFNAVRLIEAHVYMMCTYLYNCYITGIPYYEDSAFIKCTAGCHDMTLQSCEVMVIEVSVLSLDTNGSQGCDFRIDGCVIQGVREQPAFVFKKTAGVTITRCYLEGNKMGHVYCEQAGSTRLTLAGNLFLDTWYPEQDGVYKLVWGNTEGAVSIGNFGLNTKKGEFFSQPISPSFCKFDLNSHYNTIWYGNLGQDKDNKIGSILLDANDDYKMKSKISKNGLYYDYFNNGSVRKIDSKNDWPDGTFTKTTGDGSVKAVLGKSVVWNQIYNNSVPTAKAGRKYYIRELVNGVPNSSISDVIQYTENSTERMCVDLSLMYAVNDIPSEASVFETDYKNWFGETISYRQYEEGKFVGVERFSINSYGENILSYKDVSRGYYLVWATGAETAPNQKFSYDKHYYRCDENVNLYLVGVIAVYYYDKAKTYLGSTGAFVNNGIITTKKGTYYIRIGWSTKYEGSAYCSQYPFSGNFIGYEDGKTLDMTSYIGKNQTSGNIETIFPDGLHSLFDIHDEIKKSDGNVEATKRIGIIDMGDLSYTYLPSFDGATNIFYTEIPRSTINILTTLYAEASGGVRQNLTFSLNSSNRLVYFKNDDYNNASSFKDGMRGVKIMIALRNPIDYTVINDDFQIHYKADTFVSEKLESIDYGITPEIIAEYCNDNTKNIMGKGTFDEIPSFNSVDIGYEYYSTDLKKALYKGTKGWKDSKGYSPCRSSGSTQERPVSILGDSNEGSSLPRDGRKIFVGYTFKNTTNDKFYRAYKISNNAITWEEEGLRYTVPADVIRRGTTLERESALTDSYVGANLYTGFVYYNTDLNLWQYVKEIIVYKSNEEYIYQVKWDTKTYNKDSLTIDDIGFEYFDTSLNKPIYVSDIANDGTVTWVYATGAPVQTIND